MKTALILSGGGARGLIQAAYIEAFIDLGFSYDVLFGTSVGALNGAILHQGYNVCEELKGIWSRIKNSSVYSWAPWKLLTPDACVFDASPLAQNMRKHIEPTMLRVNPKPFFINCTNLTTGDSECVNVQGQTDIKIMQTLFASVSVPLAFAPVSNYCDGGVINNYSIAEAVAQGCDRLIVMTPHLIGGYKISNAFDMLNMLLSLPELHLLSRELRFVDKLNEFVQAAPDRLRRIEVVVIKPSEPTGLGLLDFDMRLVDRAQLWDRAYKSAIDQLKKSVLVGGAK